jgi:hypothetical protein
MESVKIRINKVDIFGPCTESVSCGSYWGHPRGDVEWVSRSPEMTDSFNFSEVETKNGRSFDISAADIDKMDALGPGRSVQGQGPRYGRSNGISIGKQC